MKIQLTPFLLLAFITLAVSCAQAPDAPKATASEPQQTNNQAAAGQANWAVDVQQSKVLWVGTKPTGRHNGSFDIKAGSVTVANGQLTGGSFDIDLATIAVLDEGMNDDSRANLPNPRKEPAFFEEGNSPDPRLKFPPVHPFAPTKG